MTEVITSNGPLRENAPLKQSFDKTDDKVMVSGNANNNKTSNTDSSNRLNAASKDGSMRLNSNSSPMSASPGSMSGRSSTSSLNTVGKSGAPKSAREPRKVKISIQENTSTVSSPRVQSAKESGHLKQAVSTNNINGANGFHQQPNLSSSNSNRTSLLHISAEKKARKVRFFINNDKFFKGAVIAISSEKFRTFGKLLEHLTRIMCNQVTLPNGVRFIFALDGTPIDEVDHLAHEENYVCSSTAVFKKLDYLKLAQDNDQMQWNKIRKEAYIGGGRVGVLRRETFKQTGHSKSFGQSLKNGHGSSASSTCETLKPKIIAVLRSGLKPRKAVRVLLNKRNTKNFESLLADLTNLVKLDSGAVRKVFTLEGNPVLSVSDFADSEVFIAYGSEKTQSEDFDLDSVEFKNVQSILKSPELDSKYERFAALGSPKTNRRAKFAHNRLPEKSGKIIRKASSSKSRESPKFIEANNVIACNEVAEKYLIGDIIGDGNFAVVRKCFGKQAKIEYALKVIDKSKCKGKEHMIESEVNILSSVTHPNIIELVEVYETSMEKYLVTEYVKGGDLFDAIAVDTKYSEDVSRGMIRDLTAALKYLHDKMIVHRDIKPENLLVVDYPGQGLKSLKLGDFGLAQVVTEPLYTVCGTPTYVAPEILAETGYGIKVDVWATGVIMYILLVGYPPFSSRTNNQEELFDQILCGLFEFNSPDWDDISYPAKELISWMLQIDPLQRFSAYEILQHPWIKNSLERSS